MLRDACFGAASPARDTQPRVPQEPNGAVRNRRRDACEKRFVSYDLGEGGAMIRLAHLAYHHCCSEVWTVLTLRSLAIWR